MGDLFSKFKDFLTSNDGQPQLEAGQPAQPDNPLAELLSKAEETVREALDPQPTNPADTVLDEFRPDAEEARPEAPPAPVPPAQPALAPDVSARQREAVESILGNEALTADLDDSAAKALLAWGVDCARSVAGSIADLDEQAAEAELANRLRTVRQMMRNVSGLLAHPASPDDSERAARLEKLFEQAGQIYGAASAAPGPQQAQELLQRLSELSGQPAQAIAHLRSLLETRA